MGIDARLEDENANSRVTLLDPQNAFARALDAESIRETMFLRFIDPYGDTTFNALQLPHVIDELRVLSKSSVDDRCREHIEKIIDMAQRALEGVHLYVKFYGD